MANGFTDRWQGKVRGHVFWVGGGGIILSKLAGNPNVSPADLASLAGVSGSGIGSTATLSISNGGLTQLSSVGGSTYNLAAPYPGRVKTISSVQLGDGIRKVSMLGSGASISGSTLALAAVLTLSTVTAQQSITLTGISTSAWLMSGNVGSIALSTS